jgi:hypothetical protein
VNRQTSLGLRRCRAATRLAALCLLFGLARQAAAQFLSRPSLPWRQLETPRFTFIFPSPLEDWTRDVASRIESIDSAVTRVVGYTPPRRVRVIVDDPFNVSNGYALPFLDLPSITFWATPPSPREDIGNYRAWGEMLATHEFTHVAHLSRPSRNKHWRLFTQLIPVRLGPIPTSAPRWVDEGYATYVEGRVTGSGRPNHAWRAAVLRQWALEGHLPTYGEMSAWGDFNGGDFAYLAGSAYFEWLAAREGGDSSLVNVWRRLTAKRRRTFEEAFGGVFGDGPETLYGRFTVDVTARALETRRVLSAAGLEDGELVQHLSWSTGNPAISPDGSRVAVVLRMKGRPSRVVIWRTAEPPDTISANAAAALLKSDPQDVPARRAYPLPRKPFATLSAKNGRSYEDPRFLPDGRRVLLWRNVVRGDGSSRPDIYLWDIEHNAVTRVTRDESVREPDPSPDGKTAVAVQCESGRCDLVRVDLSSGGVGTLVRSMVTSSFYRPKWSPDGRSIAVSVQQGTRWRIGVIDVDSRALRYVDPEDDGVRYDVAWISPTQLVCASERTGIANLERIDLATGAVETLTNVTGAAVAPEPNLEDHSIWFLSMHSRGYDVRRLSSWEKRISLPQLSAGSDSTLAPSIPPPRRLAMPLSRNAVGPTRGYSPTQFGFWLPTGAADADGVSAGLAIASTDIVGRLALMAKGTLASEGAWRGGVMHAAWRGWRPSVEALGYWARQLPSRAAALTPLTDSLDATMYGGALVTHMEIAGDGFSHAVRLGAGIADLEHLATGEHDTRSLVFARATSRATQTGEEGQFATETISLHGTLAALGSARVSRGIVRAGISTGYQNGGAIELTGRYGRVSSDAPAFEQFALGGLPSPIVDDDILSQRVPMSGFPSGTAIGTEVLGFRVALPGPITPYATSTRVASPNEASRWFPTYGAEITFSSVAIPVLRTPAGRLVGGAARARDASGLWKWQAYGAVLVEP